MISCGVKDNEKIKVVDLTQTLKEPLKISLSDIASDIEYIQLESTEASLITKDVTFFANDDYIITISFRQMLLFDRKTGQFLREISHYGRDPGSYNGTIKVLPFNEEANTVYASGGSKKLEFSLNGDLIDQIDLPPNAYTTAKIDEERYVGFVLFFGNDKTKLEVFDSKGEVVKSYPNYQSAPKPRSLKVYKPNGWFYRNSTQLIFCEQFNDTLFHVTADNINPRFILYRGKYKPPYEKHTIGFPLQDYFMFTSIYESDNYLFYSFDYQEERRTAVYSKDNNKILLGDYLSPNGSGFMNDIDNFSSVILSSINSQNELVGFVTAYDVVKWFEDNPDLAIGLPDKLNDFKSMKDTDNPVVIVAKLKK